MSRLADIKEIPKAINFIENFKWQVQNDKQDQDTGFIYYCTRIDQVIDLALANEVDLGYSIHRWYNFNCSKQVENIFCECGATPYLNEKDHDIDLTIEGIPFDIKLSIISSAYNKPIDLTKRKDKNEYIEWLQQNASQEGRKHTKNKIYVICDKTQDKCDFERIRAKTKAFMDYFMANIDKYMETSVCELIYVGGN